jgi:pimeloyl-ACP methyl ester carboxylesterase
MTRFVLVHGAWHGSWCWARLRRLLAARGHEVFTPTLSGLGERSHLLSRDIGLETHIADVTNLLAWEDLRDIVLVGHSYGGVVVRHAADRMADRIRSLVYLDAFVPEDGKALSDYLPDGGAADREQAARDGDGWKVSPIPASVFAVNAADAAWVDRQCTPQPLATFTTPARLTGACDGIAEIGYILATSFHGPFGQFAAVAESRGWWRHDIASPSPCGRGQGEGSARVRA